ncbi:MAG: hypothetical protein ABI690_13980 [Chloroflexota bacterium]
MPVTILDSCDVLTIAATVAGGKHGQCRRIANLVGEKLAGNGRSAAAVAQVRRVYGSDLPLCENCESPQ